MSNQSFSPTTKKANPLMQTMPLLLAGTLSLGMAIPGDQNDSVKNPNKNKDNEPGNPNVEIVPKAEFAPAKSADESETTLLSSVVVPLKYTVKKGDTVSKIAQKYGLSTAKVLTKNGLGWNSLIFPGQVLTLNDTAAKDNNSPKNPTKETPPNTGTSKTTKYQVKSGDTVSKIAQKFGVTTQSVLDANKLKWSSLIFPKQVLVIPQKTSTPKPEVKPDPKPTPPVTETPKPDPSPKPDDPSTDPSGDGPVTELPKPKPEETVCKTVSYVINPGDTVSKIAAKFGVSTSSVLKANKLSATSLIYAGKTLTIPNVNIVSDDCVVLPELSKEMRKNAQIIVDVGRAAGVSDYGLIIALATAAQESGLKNINYGDLDSVGLFQQRPASGWGTVKEIMDPVYSAKAFFGGKVNPNPGKTRGLLDIPNWQNMTVTQAAQAVQISAYPNAYAKWEKAAKYWLSTLD